MNEHREIITASPAPIATPPVDRASPGTLASELGLVRKAIFRANTTTSGWEVVMLMKIDAAKTLGVTLFEIDTTEERVRRPEPNGSLLSQFLALPLEPWQKADAGDAATMLVTVVTVYALVIE
jgi:hypothetical protein